MAILTVSAYSTSLMRTVPFKVYLPTDNRDYQGNVVALPPYPTLYLLHGILGSDSDWLLHTRVAALAKQYNIAVVMPSGENRFYVDNERAHEYYGEYVGRELVEMTRSMFPLSTRREDTWIAGLSMGGFGAMRNGLKYADTFGAIGSFSGAYILEQGLNATEDAPIFL